MRFFQEYDTNEDSGKRQRTDFLNALDTNKRTRDETSPLLDSPSSPSKPVSKRACVYDEYAASCSSTIFAHKNSDFSGSKRKSISSSKYFFFQFLMLRINLNIIISFGFNK